MDRADVRLSSPDSIHHALCDDGLIVAVYNDEDQDPVVCAATKGWIHDLEGFAEEG